MLVLGYPSAASTNIDWLELWGARINDFIRAGQVWRLLTPALLLISLYKYAKRNFSDYLYYFVLDGLMMLSGLLLWLVSRF